MNTFSNCITEEDKQKTRDMILQSLYCEIIGIRGELIDIKQKLDTIYEESVITQGEVIGLHAKLDEQADYIGDIQGRRMECGALWQK